MVAFFLLIACTGDGADSDPIDDPCDCGPGESLTLAVTEQGGFDDWGGAAVGWAVDATAGRVLVVALDYQTGVAEIDFEPACEGATDLLQSWYVSLPASAQDAVGRYPLLGAALTNAAGVRGLSQDIGALLVEGAVGGTVPEQVWVATGGSVTLLRGDGAGDVLQGALSFAARSEAVGGEAGADCEGAVRLAGLDLEWPSGGEE